MEAIEQAFSQGFPDWERIDPKARAGLVSHAATLLEANQRMNLTSLREPNRLVSELFEPSWRVGDLLDLNEKVVLDLGSGAGFPGIPLALRFPSAKFVLAESVGKKSAFLESAVQSIPLSNTRVFPGRAETLLGNQRFDFVIAQAVSSTRELLALLSRSRHSIGQVALMKGRSWESESSPAEEKESGFERQSVQPLPSPRSGDSRFLLLFRPRKS